MTFTLLTNKHEGLSSMWGRARMASNSDVEIWTKTQSKPPIAIKKIITETFEFFPIEIYRIYWICVIQLYYFFSNFENKNYKKWDTTNSTHSAEFADYYV